MAVAPACVPHANQLAADSCGHQSNWVLAANSCGHQSNWVLAAVCWCCPWCMPASGMLVSGMPACKLSMTDGLYHSKRHAHHRP